LFGIGKHCLVSPGFASYRQLSPRIVWYCKELPQHKKKRTIFQIVLFANFFQVVSLSIVRYWLGIIQYYVGIAKYKYQYTSIYLQNVARFCRVLLFSSGINRYHKDSKKQLDDKVHNGDFLALHWGIIGYHLKKYHLSTLNTKTSIVTPNHEKAVS
jgi:hypothetical protein